MNSLSKEIENDEDVREYRAGLSHSNTRVRKQLRLAGIATTSLLICMFLTYLFLDVGPFHSLWEPFGEIALTLALGALVVAVYYDALAWSAWSIDRSTKKEFKEFLEDRFGVKGKG